MLVSRIRRIRGFTLIEVLVALTILSVSLITIFAASTAALRARSKAVDYQHGTLLAESILNAVGVEQPLREGRSEGRFDSRFRWQMDVAPYHEPGRDEKNDVLQPLVVTVTVSWDGSGNEQSVSLTSLRLLPRG